MIIERFLDPKAPSLPEQVARNTDKLDSLSKVYRTTLNLTATTPKIPIGTTNIIDINDCLIGRLLFSRNGLLFQIINFDNTNIFIDFYADLSAVNEQITQFNFSPTSVVYESGKATIFGNVAYNRDGTAEQITAPAELEFPVLASNGLVIDAGEDNLSIIFKIDESVTNNISALQEDVSTLNQVSARALKVPLLAPSEIELVAVDTNNSQMNISIGNEFTISGGSIKLKKAEAVALNTTKENQNDTVVEYYVSSDGNTWYRKWASGWKEVGGVISVGTSVAVVYFPFEFTQPVRSIQLTYENSLYNPTAICPKVVIKDASIPKDRYNQIHILTPNGNGSGNVACEVSYYCCGF